MSKLSSLLWNKVQFTAVLCTNYDHICIVISSLVYSIVSPCFWVASFLFSLHLAGICCSCYRDHLDIEFIMQQYGTDKVGRLAIHTHSAPLVHLIGSVRALNIDKHDSFVLKVYNPVYIYQYFPNQGNSSYGWTIIGEIMLTIIVLAVLLIRV